MAEPVVGLVSKPNRKPPGQADTQRQVAPGRCPFPEGKFPQRVKIRENFRVLGSDSKPKSVLQTKYA